jgi:hypothetical protein
VEGIGPIDPAERGVWVRLNQGGGNVQRGLPFLGSRVDFPAHFQDIRVRPQIGRDVVQFGVCLNVVAQFEPALRGQKMDGVGRLKRLHRVEKLSSGSPSRTSPYPALGLPVGQPRSKP